MSEHCADIVMNEEAREELPVKRNVEVVDADATEKTNSFEDEVLRIELNEQERRLFDVLRKAAVTWEKGELPNTEGQRSVQIRIAGGWVRDKILGLQSNDVDIALDACTGVEFANAVKEYHDSLNDQIDTSNSGGKENANKIGRICVIAANPEQSKHLETATVKIFGNEVDFSNLRSGSYTTNSTTGSTVAGTPLEDSYRRDCTINALYYNLNTKGIEDWTGRGLRDLLSAKVIDTPLEAFETFHDDPLRMLRVIRFAVRYKMELSEKIKTSYENPQIHKELRCKVSRERIGKELEGMISGKSANPKVALNLLCEMNLVDDVFCLPDNPDIITGTVVAQSHLVETVPYCCDGTTNGEEMRSRVRKSAWNESWQCLQVLSTVLNAITVRSGDSNARKAEMILQTNSVPPNVFTPVDVRLVYLAVVLLPFRQLKYLEKRKTKSVVEYIIREQIKFKNKDADSISILTENLDDVVRLLQQNVEDTPTMRLQVGLFLRATKEMWTTALIVATVILSRKQQASSDEIDWCSRAKELYETIVIEMKLDKCWASKPLINGKELVQTLGLDRGPEVGVYMREQVKWTFTNPDGTVDQLHDYLKRFKNARDLENNDQAGKHISKKPHL